MDVNIMQDESIISQILGTDFPETLFHYTSSVGLMGIIASKKIWSTKIHYLNDSSELQLAFEYIREEIEFQKSNSDRTRSIEELNDMVGALDSIATINVSVASLTERDDHLSQWRGYCKIGDGYSIGFDGRKLRERVSKDDDYYLLPCAYEEDQHRLIAKELVNSTTVMRRPITSNSDVSPLGMMSFKEAALFIAPMIKAKGFYEEKEWRLISKPLIYKNAKFRSGNFSLIPYWEFDVDLENTLKSVTIGPTPKQELSEAAVQGLIQKNLINPYVVIKHSEIPFSLI
jgi:hypothetical protein